ncbi:MAG: hypothetical protein AAGC63_12435 [Propionicimonas sp.]|nr:hypothetical protein [Propionicimonas sp.]
MLATLDRATRAYWRLVGRRVDPAGADPWLAAPIHDAPVVGEDWIAATVTALGGVRVEDAGQGLLPDLAVLDGPGFDAAAVHPLIRDFYQTTAAWRMDVWTGWAPPFALFGGLVTSLFGRRVRQLALPIRPLEVSRGLTSRVVALLDADGRQYAAAWLRTLRATGDVVFSGCYKTATLPGATGRSVHVSFPLEHGNVQVFLRPANRPGGGLVLSSPPGRFGHDGAYVLVRHGGAHHAVRLPLHEEFELFVDDDGVLRTDHTLRLWSWQVLRLHYRMERLG